MNSLGLLFVWTSVQVSLLALGGAAYYAWARRRSPAAGTLALSGTIAIAVGLAALAVVPWPSWWTRGETDSATVSAAREATAARELPVVETQPSAARAPAQADPEHTARPPARGAATTDSTWQTLLSMYRAERERLDTTASAPVWGWPAWVAVAALACCAAGLTRLLIALWAAQRYRRRAQPVADAAILEALDAMRTRIGCRRAIELREAATSGSPSTLGWLRPVIILPADWRTWTDEQRQAVLAHEVAHVARGDFAAALAAQLGVVVHFYNPLIHWLAGRLRLEQELAADLCGARHAGGRRTYLTALAEMALARSNPNLAWAARPFLPTRGTLMRRIEMLHARELPAERTLSPLRRWALCAGLLAVGLLLAGLREPTVRRVVAAPPEEKPSQPIDLDFVPAETAYLLALRPADLVNSPRLKGLEAAFHQTGLLKALDLPLAEIEQFKLMACGRPIESSSDDWGVLVLRSKRPHDWSKLGSYALGKAEQKVAAGQVYFRSLEDAKGRQTFGEYWLPDDRTIVMTPSGRITETFALRGSLNAPPWVKQWEAAATGPAALMLRTDMLEFMLGKLDAPPGAVAIFAGHETEDAFVVEGRMPGGSPAAADKLAQQLRAGLARGREIMAPAAKAPDGIRPAIGIPSVAVTLIDATEIAVDESTVVSRTTLEAKQIAEVAAAIAPAREAARRAVASNRMKQLLIGLINYHDVYKRFPPAVVMGPDGKTPHSWRVELLPFLEMNDLYKAYRMDEPWDSEHNKQLIEHGAELFSVPSADDEDRSCGYFLLVGPGTAFDPALAKLTIRDIRDGTSRTIGLVEAKREVPWTKPEDIKYDPNGPLPKLGGFHEPNFLAGLMDGRVLPITPEVDEDTLRALITRDGREPVDPNALLPR